MEIAKMTSKGQITIPKDIREKLNLETGSKVVFIKRGNDWVVFNPEQALASSSAAARKLDESERNGVLQELAARYDVYPDPQEQQSPEIEQALGKLQSAFDGVAEEQGWKSNQDVADYINSLRHGSEE